MKFDALSKNIENIKSSLSLQFELKLNFLPCNKVLIKNWEDENKLPIPVKGDEIGNKSGVYFLVSESDDILYIGKATTNNIHERIWGHLKTPEVIDKKQRRFPKNNFINRGLNEDMVSLVTNGAIYYAALEVSPSYLCSLVEVYLHSIYTKNYDNLPPLNKQIG